MRVHLIPCLLLALWVTNPPVSRGAVPAEGGAAAAAANSRWPRTDMDFRAWLQNMVVYHQFTPEEVHEATGVEVARILSALKVYRFQPGVHPPRAEDAPLLVLPYPGGRHPRIGFLEGAVNPQRETKLSVFAPWDESSYVVIDVPEALWSNLGLTYLAHTHVPTLWTKANIELPRLEWRHHKDGAYHVERKLPNGIAFATKAIPTQDAVRLEVKLTNGTTNTLTDLRVQMCAMLKGMEGFNQQTNANKVFGKPFVACRNEEGTRWVIWAWEPCHRAWGNPPVPCLHSDPKFPDAKPGESKVVRGRLSFYEGKEINAELRRIEQDPWIQRAASGEL
ncbi:MAG TPA: hypothetical protein DCM86_06420 [Verrucomicrobiales bacterium]|nr:hypothetical protein [Verrucomicrobiales bacterium]